MDSKSLTATIRPAHDDDLPRLVQIYNHYVIESPATFDIEPFTVETRRGWFDGFAATGAHRLLVAELAGELAGYASSIAHRPKPAYDCSVETTTYLDPDFVGRGVGSHLYATLLELLRAERRVHRAFAGITIPNPASVALHERLGFEKLGTFHEIGYKFGKYWDVSWFECDLSQESNG